MKEIQPTTQYRKDLKRYRNKPKKLAALANILQLLANEQPIPKQYLPHMLTGRYKGCMECHIEGDFLLIWIDEQRNIIELVRLGSHSELFG
jgi:mRNA interferase YafQ